MSKYASSLVAVVTLFTATLAQSAAAQTPSDAPSVRGQAEYEKYCASCHGLKGDGHGPVAPAMNVPPTDLTTLGERYGQPLPRTKLMAFIDGRRPLISHGSREMPIWGEKLWENLPSRTPEARKRSTILVIIDYLDSLQPPAD
jgi:mono/diheme cytochrome c family protein